MDIGENMQFCGRTFTTQELRLVAEVVRDFGRISRLELSHTVCELLDWKRPGGGLKARECRDLLERLEFQGFLKLPAKRTVGAIPLRRLIAKQVAEKPYSALTGDISMFAPVFLEVVQNRQQRELFKELVGRYHYLGYAMPYGARLQYLAYAQRPRRELVGCIQYSSPAWRMRVRDQWIGWDDTTRGLGLQHVVNNSRFLVLAGIRNLASAILACSHKRLCSDWQNRYGVAPFLVETLVDTERFHGGCYRAANFLVLGKTTGRGRMDRQGTRNGACVKTVMVYPLVKNAASRLAQGR
ncbi:MAG: Druantia anti-phage system protein DruA [Desulfatitalea sp.]